MTTTNELNAIFFGNGTASHCWRIDGTADRVNKYTPDSVYVTTWQKWNKNLAGANLVILEMLASPDIVKTCHEQGAKVIWEADDAMIDSYGDERKNLQKLNTTHRQTTIDVLKEVDALTVTNQKAATAYTLPAATLKNVENLVISNDSGAITADVQAAVGLTSVTTTNATTDALTIDTKSNARSVTATKAFSQPVILIAGGSDKGLHYDEWAARMVLNKNVKLVILMGGIADKMAASLRLAEADFGEKRKAEGAESLQVLQANSFEDAFKLAQQSAKVGEIVLLSPAAASFDMFENYKKRGERFKELAMKIPNQ